MRQLAARRVIAVRPYGERIRNRVFDCLREANLSLDEDDVIAEGTSDDDVLAFLRERPGAVLLVPFHAHHAPDGDELTGLDLVLRISRELPAFRRSPVLMPISIYAAAVAWLRLARLDGEVRTRILPLQESDLGDSELPSRIREHIAHVAVTSSEQGG